MDQMRGRGGDDCKHFRQALDRIGAEDGREATDMSNALALHLDDCPDCRRRFDRGAVPVDRSAFETLNEPARERLIGALGRTRALNLAALVRLRPAREIIAAAAFAAVLAIMFAGLWIAHERRGASLESPRELRGAGAVTFALVEDHIRYLNQPERAAGTDAGALEADLNAYLDFPMRVPRPPDTRLTGGRRCFLLGRRVGLAFYDTPGGSVSYFVLAAENLELPSTQCPQGEGLSCSSSHGYLVVTWTRAGLLHALVGAEAPELVRLARYCSA